MPLLHTPEEAADIIGSEIVTASWLREQARQRAIPFTLISGRYAFTAMQLTEIIEMHAQGPALPPPGPRRRESGPKTQPEIKLRARPPASRARRGQPKDGAGRGPENR